MVAIKNRCPSPATTSSHHVLLPRNRPNGGDTGLEQRHRSTSTGPTGNGGDWHCHQASVSGDIEELFPVASLCLGGLGWLAGRPITGHSVDRRPLIVPIGLPSATNGPSRFSMER